MKGGAIWIPAFFPQLLALKEKMNQPVLKPPLLGVRGDRMLGWRGRFWDTGVYVCLQSVTCKAKDTWERVFDLCLAEW